MYAKFYHNIPLSSRDRAIFTFSEFGARQNLDRRKMSFCNLFGYSLLISMFRQKFIKIFHSVQEIGLFSFFFRIWTSATPRSIPNDSWQSFGLCLVNINAYAKFYQNIPNGLRVIDIFRHFSRTGRGQNLHKLSGDKIKCLVIGHSMKFNFKFQLTFLGSCNLLFAYIALLAWRREFVPVGFRHHEQLCLKYHE